MGCFMAVTDSNGDNTVGSLGHIKSHIIHGKGSISISVLQNNTSGSWTWVWAQSTKNLARFFTLLQDCSS